jgi:hypothetical protein
MTGNPDRSLTIDTHHHLLPDFFWQATENAHAPVGGLAPLRGPRKEEAGMNNATNGTKRKGWNYAFHA